MVKVQFFYFLLMGTRHRGLTLAFHNSTVFDRYAPRTISDRFVWLPRTDCF